MNIHFPDMDEAPTRADVEAAAALLRRWAGAASADEVEAFGPILPSDTS